MSRGKVNLGESTIGQGNIDLHKEQEAAEWAALEKTGLGLPGLGDGAPNDPLILSKLPPAFGDRAESPTDRDLSRGAGIIRDKSRVTVLAIPVGLPDSVPPFPRSWNIKDSQNGAAGASSSRPRSLPGNYAILQTTACFNPYSNSEQMSSLHCRIMQGGCPEWFPE